MEPTVDVNAAVWTPTSLCAAMSRSQSTHSLFSDTEDLFPSLCPPPRIHTGYSSPNVEERGTTNHTSQSVRTINEIAFDFEYPPLSYKETPTPTSSSSSSSSSSLEGPGQGLGHTPRSVAWDKTPPIIMSKPPSDKQTSLNFDYHNFPSLREEGQSLGGGGVGGLEGLRGLGQGVGGMGGMGFGNSSGRGDYSSVPHTPYTPLDEPYTPTSSSNNTNNTTTTANKCRQLPCRTFLATGTCPYDAKCFFLHDPRLTATGLRPGFRPPRQSYNQQKKEEVVDSFFWPPMSYQAVTYSGKLDAKNLPLVNQHYLIPLPSSLPSYASSRDKRNAVAIQSMWKHFLDQLAVSHLRVFLPSQDATEVVNSHTNRPRLPIFVSLSKHKG